MKLADFKVEQWMNENEGQAKYNLTDTCLKWGDNLPNNR